MHKQTRRLFFRRLYVKRGKLRVGCSFAMLPIAKSAQMLPLYRPGLTNLWHACPKWQAEFTAVPLCFYLPSRPASVCCEKCIYIYIHIHISDLIEIVYELPLLPNNSASETFFNKSGAVRSVDWISIFGMSAWWWLGEYVTLDKTFYNLIFQQEVISAPSYFHFCFLITFLEDAFIRNIM